MIVAVVFVLGLALVTAGAAIVYVPAGLVLAGLALMGGCWLWVRGGAVAA